MPLKESLGFRKVTDSIVLQFIFISIYTALLTPLSNRIAHLDTSPPHSSSSLTDARRAIIQTSSSSSVSSISADGDHEDISRPEWKKKILWSVFPVFGCYMDICSASVVLMSNTIPYVSAEDSPYAALGVYLFTFLLPLTFLDIAWNALGTWQHQQTPSRQTTRAILSITATTILSVLLIFGKVVSRLHVHENMQKFINIEHIAGRDLFIELSSWVFYIRWIIILSPKRISRHWSSFLYLTMVVSVYIIFEELVLMEPIGKPDSYEYAYTSMRKYILKDWDGSILMYAPFLFSSIAWSFNPFWRVKFLSDGPHLTR